MKMSCVFYCLTAIKHVGLFHHFTAQADCPDIILTQEHDQCHIIGDHCYLLLVNQMPSHIFCGGTGIYKNSVTIPDVLRSLLPEVSIRSF